MGIYEGTRFRIWGDISEKVVPLNLRSISTVSSLRFLTVLGICSLLQRCSQYAEEEGEKATQGYRSLGDSAKYVDGICDSASSLSQRPEW